MLFMFSFLGVTYFQTGRGNTGLRINGYVYKRHYKTANSVYWICTLNNKHKCKQRVISERENPFAIKFKGPGHNHGSDEYGNSNRSGIQRSMHGIKGEICFKEEITEEFVE